MNIQHLRLRQKRINELEETLKHEHGWDTEQLGQGCSSCEDYILALEDAIQRAKDTKEINKHLFQLDKAADNEKTMA